MSTDLAVINVVHPYTGETLELTQASVEDLAAFLTELREYESRSREVKRAVFDETLRRMDAQAKWTIHTPDYELCGSSPAPSEEWDELALYSDLWDLVDKGIITEDAANSAIETVVTYKVRKNGINALRKLNAPVPDVVNRHSHEVQKDRRISVTRRSVS